MMTVGDLAAAYNIRPVTIRAWARRGILPELGVSGAHRRLGEAEVRLVRLTAGLSQIIPASKAAEIARTIVGGGKHRIEVCQGLSVEVDVDAFLSET